MGRYIIEKGTPYILCQRMIKKNKTWREKYPAKTDLKSRCDWETASRCKKKTKAINTKLIRAFSTREEDAIAVFSSPSLAATNFICAFFKRLDLVDSNKLVITKKNAHKPISGLDKLRISIIKLINPNTVSEKR